MKELERTFLVKNIPSGLHNCKFKEIIDVYIPKELKHPSIRLRKDGDKYEITKKEPMKDDPSEMIEQTIVLREHEFLELMKLEGKKAHKLRHYFDHNGRTAEVDVFQGALKGLILVDFEFENIELKNNFIMPDFCLAEVTQERFIAGGMICGKAYSDIEEDLKKYNYSKLFM